MSNEQEIDTERKLNEDFNNMDADQDGFISVADMRRLDLDSTEDELELIFRMMDIDRDGKVSLREYLRVMRVKQTNGENETDEQNFASLFKILDSDSDGFISQEDLKLLDPKMSETDVSIIFNLLDNDKDGKVSELDFVNGMLLMKDGQKQSTETDEQQIKLRIKLTKTTAAVYLFLVYVLLHFAFIFIHLFNKDSLPSGFYWISHLLLLFFIVLYIIYLYYRSMGYLNWFTISFVFIQLALFLVFALTKPPYTIHIGVQSLIALFLIVMFFMM